MVTRRPTGRQPRPAGWDAVADRRGSRGGAQLGVLLGGLGGGLLDVLVDDVARQPGVLGHPPHTGAQSEDDAVMKLDVSAPPPCTLLSVLEDCRCENL